MVRKIMPLLLLAFAFSACKSHDHGFHDKPVTPSIAGIWAGSVKINNVNTNFKLTLQQSGALVQGVYTSDGVSQALGVAGTVTGATTGPAFSLNMAANAPACAHSLQIGGANSGSELSFNLIGTDCNDTELRGESLLSKQPN